MPFDVSGGATGAEIVLMPIRYRFTPQVGFRIHSQDCLRKSPSNEPISKISAMKKPAAVAYIRTSSAANRSADKDSERRKRDAIGACAKKHGLDIVATLYDAAVSGADPVDQRPAFVEMMTFC